MSEHKFCHKCATSLPHSSFYTNSARKDGLQTYCKSCMANTNASSYVKHKKESNKKNLEYQRTSEKSKMYKRKWAKNKYDTDPAHREKIIKNAVETERKRLKTDMEFKLKKNLRGRFRDSLKRKKTNKSCSVIDLIGCSIYQLECHIEKKFEEYMNWSNYGNWHIDHIIPCNAFDLNNEFEKRACFHYTNLQPIWASDNIKKGDKYCEEEKKVFLSQYISLIKHI